MVKVEAIESNNKRRGCIVPLAKGAMTGAAIGLALKYAQPVTADEKNTPEYRKVVEEIQNKKNSYSPWTDSYLKQIKSKSELSKAEDVFVKTYDGMKHGEQVGRKRLMKALRSLENQDRGELRVLYENARYQAEVMAKKYMSMNNLLTKYIRPTGFFLTTGAVIGAIIALIHSVMSTEVKH